MASLILGAAGAALGPSLFGGFSLLGATITGAQIGGALGAILGSEIDAALAPGRRVSHTGPRLSDINIQSSTEGAAIPRLYGRIRAAGQLIWATKFKETVVTSKTSGGGKGAPKVTATDTEYPYSVSFAVALCEGEIARLGRVWADGTLIDLTQFTTRLHKGTQTQTADPLIEETEGAGNTPAYRGTAYIVFEDMPLASFAAQPASARISPQRAAAPAPAATAATAPAARHNKPARISTQPRKANTMQSINGYKTYIVAGATILYTAAQLWSGAIDTPTAIFAILGALGLGGLRHALTAKA